MEKEFRCLQGISNQGKTSPYQPEGKEAKLQSENQNWPSFQCAQYPAWIIYWLKNRSDTDNAENESESEHKTRDKEESDEEYNYSDIELSLSDTDEFERLSALGYLKEKVIWLL